jgi:choline dehydrogenase-like flavoprotein
MKVGVVVIGAGPAGVTAARELKEKGISAVVVEAQGRIGGRILNTHDPTNPPEIRNFSKFPREHPPTSPQRTSKDSNIREGPMTSSCLTVEAAGAVPSSSWARPQRWETPRPLLVGFTARAAREVVAMILCTGER